jgi:hypothetical protein
LGPVLVATLLACACEEKGRDDAGTADAAGAKSAAPAEAPATQAPPPPVDEFMAQFQGLRAEVRKASLMDWVKLEDNIPFYKISFKIDPVFMSYDGHTDLWVMNRSDRAWDRLVFHLYPNSPAVAGALAYLRVKQARIDGRPVAGVDQKTRYEIPLAEPLLPGRALHVEMEFQGLVKRFEKGDGGPSRDVWRQLLDVLGEESGDWGIFGCSSGVVSMALSYPILASFDAAGWDIQPPSKLGDFSYFDVSDYLVTVEMDPGYDVVGTGKLLERNGEVSRFAAGGVREFMMVAGKGMFALSRKAGPGGDVEINAYALAAGGDTHRLVLKTAAESLDEFEGLFGPYPYRELDVVQTDLFSGIGGVEFPGLISIASLMYMDSWKGLVPEAADFVDSRFMREATQFVVAHEVAHQWWNAVVGSHSRNHPFLDEALANYSAVLYFDRVGGPEAAARQLLFELKLPYQLYRLLGGEDRPVDLATTDFTDMVAYGAIVYSKGGLMLHELRNRASLDALRRGLTDYYSRFMFKVAVPEDLTGALGAAWGRPEEMQALAQRWLKGTYGDEDIGRFDPGEVVPALLAEFGLKLDNWFLDMLKQEGFWELVQVAANIVEGKPDMFEGVEIAKVTDWLTQAAKKVLMDILM